MTNRSNVKLIWLCSPNNPTGQIIKPNLIEKVVKKSKAFVVLDQAFNQINSRHGLDSNLKLAIKNRNLIVLQSLSKIWGLAGLRVGWAIGHPETIKILEKFRLPFNIASISQKLAIAALSDGKHLKKVNKFIIKERVFIENELRKLPNFEICSGSKTLFFLLRHKSKDLFELLLKRNILTADFRQANGLKGMGFVRITIRTRKENELLLKVLKQIN